MTCGACGVDEEDVPDPVADPFARYRDLLPAGAVPVAVAGVIEYMVDPKVDGVDFSMRYSLVHVGDVPLSTFMGLLELAKSSVFEWFNEHEGGS